MRLTDEMILEEELKYDQDSSEYNDGFFDGHSAGAKFARRYYESISPWIPVSRPPAENIAVLTTNMNGVSFDEREPEKGFLEDGEWYLASWNSNERLTPTHWMPLPKLPGE